MIVALGIFFSGFMAPHELQNDGPEEPMERFKMYREAAGYALAWGKYTSPTSMTLQPLLLYVEAEFLMNRSAQLTCYVLAGVCIRLMMKMGLHRDPSKLPNISAFDGEMRRRMWSLVIQIDLLVSFHMGLPSMISGIESDTVLPRNLLDTDFDEDSSELPLARPPGDFTQMSYPIFKSTLCRVFGQIARQSHSLTTPSYAEVLRLDGLLEEKWKALPEFMHIKSLSDCIGDPAMLIIQRFGLSSLYHKSRCVLHRRYLLEPIPKQEHEYSRKRCLESALTLLNHQHTVYEACQPGRILNLHGWFISALAVHDFLLASMIVYLVIRSETYSEVGGNYNWMMQDTPTATKDELRQILKRTYDVWSNVPKSDEIKKASDILATMLKKVGQPVGSVATVGQAPPTSVPSVATGAASRSNPGAMANLSLNGLFHSRPPKLESRG